MPSEMPLPWQDVLTEYLRQANEGNSYLTGDGRHSRGEIAQAASVYAMPDDLRDMLSGERGRHTSIPPCPRWWPWAASQWKPTTRRQELVKAAALILAEIDRLDRASMALES